MKFNLVMESNSFSNNVTSINFVSTALEESETTINIFMEEVKTYTTFKIATFIATYWFPVLVPVGVMGNILSFIVMIKPNNRKMSTCIYMAAISINDNIMMYVCTSKSLWLLFSKYTHGIRLNVKSWHFVLYLACKIVHFKF